MKKLIVLLAVVLLAGCSTFGKVMSTPPDKSKEALDQICSNSFGTATVDNSNFDYWLGGFAGAHVNWREKLTAQQLSDVQSFQEFCKKDPATRTAYEYGYQTGVFVRTIKDLLPAEILGKAAMVLK